MGDEEMNEAVKRRWIAALRSGKYRQGEGCLCATAKGRTRFCCLGVLANEELDAEWVFSNDPYNPTWSLHYKGDEDDGLLPKDARRELGLSADQEQDLSDMNDEGKSFREIADWIEENL